jgi:hypothetical protein
MMNMKGIDVQNLFKKYFDGFDLAKVFREKISSTANSGSARKGSPPIRDTSAN